MKIIPTTELIAPRLVQFARVRRDARPAHARTGDPVAIDSYIGKGRRFDPAIAVRPAYADQTSATTSSWPPPRESASTGS